MRLLRIRLRNFRGVDDREVEFLRDGVTVVVGPNEVGKSSIAEALDLLLEELDTTTKQSVKDVKPVHRDAGPEVEAEVESGPYAFTYRKRFLKDRETTLRVTRPAPENLTGRQAHERVAQMLGETMDTALWRALRIVQGAGVGQAALRDATSLGQALDRAAGTVPEGQAEVTLFERARAEYLGYFTDTGRPVKREQELRAAVADRETAVAQVDVALRAIARDVDRDAVLTARLAELAAARRGQEARVAELERQWQEVEALRAQVAALEADNRAAALESAAAAGASSSRSALAEALAAAVAERDRQASVIAAVAPDVEAARDRLGGASQGLEAARQALAAAEDAERAARADLEYLREVQVLESLLDRRRRVIAAREAMSAAEAVLRTNLVDSAHLDAVREASVALQVARGLLEAARPSVTVTALRDVTLEVDGQEVALLAGETARRVVAERLSIALPDVLRLDVAAGAGEASLAGDVTAAEAALRSACAASGVADVAAAEAAHAARLEAGRAVERHRREMEELLRGDASRSELLDARITEGQRRTAGFLDRRQSSAPVPADVTAAAEAAQGAESALAIARRVQASAEAEERTARDRHAQLAATAAEARVRLGIAADAAAAREAELAGARQTLSDAQLAAAAAQAEARHAETRAAVEAAAAKLAAAGPDAVQARLADERRAARDAAARQRELEDERLAVRARLRDHGEDGLAERRDALLTALDAARATLDRHLAAAAARRRLYEALRAARDASRLAYIGPLRARVESLGRVVFGDDLAVDIGEDLQIRSRTLGGRTVPFSSLSIGAQEQLAVITRLACAMIVAPDGGVPVVLDDTLGYADPVRLEGMGRVLATAGASSQVVVLTCHPERYRHVGGARIVALG